MRTPEIILKGLPICRGIAIGKPLFLTSTEEEIPELALTDDLVADEVTRYQRAIQLSHKEIKQLQEQLQQERISEGVTILEAHLQMMQDPLLTSSVEDEIRSSKKNAESALQTLLEGYREKFNALEDPFFRERFKDIQEISKRIVGHLRSNVKSSLALLPPNSIVFSRELTVSDTVEAHASKVSAFVTECGSPTSHAAIVAKARGTPFVSNISYEKLSQYQHQMAIVDGRTGDIILNPTATTLQKYQIFKDQLQAHLEKLANVGTYPTETYDGYPVRLSANIEVATELDDLHQHGGHGVGLYRSEYIFFSKDKFPSEEEQYETYRALVSKMYGLPIVIRTFDVGGDKGLPNQYITHEMNPFLGCRAIRFLLKEREIFKTQLRAILRASIEGEVSIMFPMVSTLSELIEAKEVIQEARLELEQRGIAHGKVRIGCMIEVPSAAIIADLLAKECDFLSIGTNDLVQYALAVDRGNHEMSALYTPTHPSVIRLIKLVVHEANNQGIPVTVCGEVAADPRFTPLLLGLGVHELSVATRYIPTVKHAIRCCSIVEASRLAEAALKLKTAPEIQELLAQEYRKNVPADTFYNY